MTTHEPLNWNNIIALRISFDLRDLDIHATDEGLLHIAEHLMFLGGGKITPDIAYEKQVRLFDTLHAQTSRGFVTLDAVFPKEMFNEAVQYLSDMVYSWDCSEGVFEQEKEGIVVEAEEFFADVQTKAVEVCLSKMAGYIPPSIGSAQVIKKSTYANVRSAWERMLQCAPRDLIILGAVDESQKSVLENTFVQDHGSVSVHSIERQPLVGSVGERVKEENIIASIFSVYESELFFFLLQRLYYMRWVRQNPFWGYTFFREKNMLGYVVFGDELKNDSDNAEHMLFDAPSVDEFTEAKQIVLEYIHRLNDGVEPQEVLDHIHACRVQGVAELYRVNMSDAPSVVQTYTYDEFLNTWRGCAG